MERLILGTKMKEIDMDKGKTCEICKKQSPDVEYDSYEHMTLCRICNDGCTEAGKQAEAGHP